MKIESLNLYHNIYLIGIGGSGISGLARILASKNKQVRGSDLNSSYITEQMISEGISVYIGSSASNITSNIDLVIYSAAVPTTDFELNAAKSQNIPCLSYPEAVGLLCKDYSLIAVTGTHGKTTTTSMIGVSMIAENLDPTVLVGANLKEFGGKNEHIGKSKYFVLEACEYKNSFLNYHPHILLINNLELDHLDFFPDFASYQDSFHRLVNQVHSTGTVIANGDVPEIRELLKNCPVKVIYFGQNTNNDYRLIDQSLHFENQTFPIKLELPGIHNLMNAAAALTVIHQITQKIPQAALEQLSKFQGAARRFELKGILGKTAIIDDYAHHPSAIQTTIQATKEKYGQNAKILVIHQPHQYSRTKALINEYATCFQGAYQVIISDIFAARDSAQDLASISVDQLVERIKEHHLGPVLNGQGLENSAAIAKSLHQQFDVILCMGAGSIYQIASKILA